MYKTDTPAQPRPARPDCCPEPDCACGLRNNYYVGKRLTPDAFTIEQRFLNGRRHLLNRTLFGAGVVKGYAVAYAQDALRDQPPGCLLVSAGLALDEAGHELLSTETLALRMDDVIVLDESGRPRARCKDGRMPFQRGSWWKLCVHYAERAVSRMTVHDECSCERHPWDRVCETVRFSLAPMKDFEACCEKPGCSFECGCPEGGCCGKPVVGQPRKAGGVVAEGPVSPVPRGGCECLCHAVSRPLEDCDAVCLTPVEDACGPVCVDLQHCVALACVQLVADDCGNGAFSRAIEPCGPRPLVLNNRLLFDLIRGCDLTRMRVGWDRFHGMDEPVPWERFQRSFGNYDKDQGWVGGIYQVAFTRPVFAATLRPECFAMTVIVRREESRWGRVIRVPIVGLDLEAGGGAGMAVGARLRFDLTWYREQIEGDASAFNDEIALVEIEVRGERILDCNGLAVDVDANGTPGGLSFVAFRVGPPPASIEDEKHPDPWMSYQAAAPDQPA